MGLLIQKRWNPASYTSRNVISCEMIHKSLAKHDRAQIVSATESRSADREKTQHQKGTAKIHTLLSLPQGSERQDGKHHRCSPLFLAIGLNSDAEVIKLFLSLGCCSNKGARHYVGV